MAIGVARAPEPDAVIGEITAELYPVFVSSRKVTKTG
jgi:hypothetical protein